jgi:transglutaminase-like putative cysteine protease
VSRSGPAAVAAVTALAIACPTAHAARAPEWLAAAIATVSPAASKDVHAHLLLQESHITYRPRGRMALRQRGAVRVLDRQGAGAAVLRVPYDQRGASFAELRGWLVDPGGRVSPLSRDREADVRHGDWGTLATDMRMRMLVAGDAPPGTVFAWEYVLEEDVLLSDIPVWSGAEHPCALERIEVELPEGADLQVTVRGDGPPATRDGNTWRWERRDVPPLPSEPWSGPWVSWRSGMTLIPRGSAKAPIAGVSFASWPEAARWLHAISEASVVPTPEITARAQSLTAGLATPLDRARALARFTQSVNYVHVAVGLARGEGYRPHPAGDVLRSGYGDCKDKAGLFCSLARSIGLEAWLAAACTRGRDAVYPDWTSPQQFDHCIAAVRLPEPAGLEAATSASGLVFLDPTDPHTPFGHLPAALAGSWVLLEHPERGELLRLPGTSAERAHSSSSLTATLDSLGTLIGTWRLVARGPEAQRQRAIHADAATWRPELERELTEWLGPCAVSGARATDAPDSNTFRIEAQVVVARFAKMLGGDLVGFRAGPARGPAAWAAADEPRRTPIVLPRQARDESVDLALPASWRLEETPEAIEHRQDFGAFTGRWTGEANRARFQFALTLEPVTLPPARHGAWKELLAAWSRAARTQLVVHRR